MTFRDPQLQQNRGSAIGAEFDGLNFTSVPQTLRVTLGTY